MPSAYLSQTLSRFAFSSPLLFSPLLETKPEPCNQTNNPNSVFKTSRKLTTYILQRYAISVARKLGATVFCSWEDIVEVKPKMTMVFTAALMDAALSADSSVQH